MNVAHHQCDRALGGRRCLSRLVTVGGDAGGRGVGNTLKAVDAKLAPAGGEVRPGYFLYGQARHKFDYKLLKRWAVVSRHSSVGRNAQKKGGRWGPPMLQAILDNC